LLIPPAKSTSQIPARDIIVGIISWRSGPIIPRAGSLCPPLRGAPLFFLLSTLVPRQDPVGGTEGSFCKGVHKWHKVKKETGRWQTDKKRKEGKKRCFPPKVEQFEEWRWLPSEESLDAATCTTSQVASHVYLRFQRHRSFFEAHCRSQSEWTERRIWMRAFRRLLFIWKYKTGRTHSKNA